jgi:hypothetical protein
MEELMRNLRVMKNIRRCKTRSDEYSPHEVTMDIVIFG